MEFLWSPWRYDYITNAGKTPASCVFDVGTDTSADDERLIVHRGVHNFVILNLFPYTSGHFLVVPYDHIAEIESVSPETMAEMMGLARRGIAALRKLYKPEGFNVGMNLGHCAGAGVREHIHLHVVPRWVGDANYVALLGETRVLPEELSITLRRMREVF